LLKGKTGAVDATFLEANAAMKSIVRRDTGEGWGEYIKRLAEEEGVENPSDDDARRLDRKRKKSVSNEEWESKTDPDSRIAKRKDGRTNLVYKAEHAVDSDTAAVVADPSIVQILPTWSMRRPTPAKRRTTRTCGGPPHAIKEVSHRRIKRRRLLARKPGVTAHLTDNIATLFEDPRSRTPRVSQCRTFPMLPCRVFPRISCSLPQRR